MGREEAVEKRLGHVAVDTYGLDALAELVVEVVVEGESA